MPHCPPSTIAQLLFECAPGKSFPALVRELDDALSQRGGTRQIRWDNDDVVFVDFDGSRVGLGYFERPAPGLAACLTITAGPAPGMTGSSAATAYEHLCQRLVACANQTLHADTVLWLELPEPVTADLVDSLIDLLDPAAYADAIPMHVPEEPSMSVFRAAHPAPTRDRHGKRMAQRFPALQDSELERLQQALRSTPEDGTPTNAQRLSAHAMNATLTLLIPPVGAGLLAASYRYGVNLKHSARAMGVAGAFFGLAHSAAAADFMPFLLI